MLLKSSRMILYVGLLIGMFASYSYLDLEIPIPILTHHLKYR